MLAIWNRERANEERRIAFACSDVTTAPFRFPQEFVEEVMELVELTPLRNALVGSPGVSGLPVEARKRLTIAVELVANPSIIFMDEPTSGLGAQP